MSTFTRRAFFCQSALALPAFAGRTASPPHPYGALPSQRQIHWSRMEYYNFLHFSMNTFTDREWGYGNDSPALFNPTCFDADAIAETLASSGSAGIILTCKHHDGFCLWPTRTTDYSIKSSPYKGGRGDIVREISDAARRHGLKFGVYCSPWDRHQASYGTPEYVRMYREQLRELLTGYGPIFEVWHDGANGGSGYYGGANTTRIIDKQHYYEWPATWALERKLQPDAVLFSDAGPDIRWVGNEKGIAGETCWATYTPHGAAGGPPAPGDIDEREATTGTRNGKFWMPAECDVSIRPGWFWHKSENAKVKTPHQLLALFCKSAGRGASFLLNVPPDRRGLIGETDTAALRGFARLRNAMFSGNLAAHAKVTASNVRGRSAAYRPENMLDGTRDTYWSTDDSETRPQAVFEFHHPVQFRAARLREAISLGQRVGAFAIDVWQSGSWSMFAQGTSIGNCRILRSELPLSTQRVRLRIIESPVCPAISEFALFAGDI